MDTKQDKETISFKLNESFTTTCMRWFCIQTILIDMESEKVRGLIPLVNINISVTNEHAADGKKD